MRLCGLLLLLTGGTSLLARPSVRECAVSFDAYVEKVVKEGSLYGVNEEVIREYLQLDSHHNPETLDLKIRYVELASLSSWLGNHPEFVAELVAIYNQKRPGADSYIRRDLTGAFERTGLRRNADQIEILVRAIDSLPDLRGKATPEKIRETLATHLGFEMIAIEDRCARELEAHRREEALQFIESAKHHYTPATSPAAANNPALPLKVVLTPEFSEWLAGVDNPPAIQSITRAVQAATANGVDGFLDKKLISPPNGSPYWEVRIPVQPGFRLYYRIDPETKTPVMLIGGTKPKEGRRENYAPVENAMNSIWNRYRSMEHP